MDRIKHHISKAKETLISHWPYILALVVLSLLFSYEWLNPNYYPWGEHISSYYPRAEILKQGIEKGDFLPLWNPYTMSGTPFFAKADTVSIGHQLYLFLLIFPPLIALKINYILNIFLAGLFMYILGNFLKWEKKFSLLAAIVFIFNGLFTKIFMWGWQTTIDSYVLIPLVLLFTIKAVKEKEWVKNSIFLSLIFAWQIFGGPDLKVFLFSAIMFGIYLAFALIGENIKTRLIKMIMIGALVSILVVGFSAIRIIPTKEYLDLSSRAKIAFNDAYKRPLYVKDYITRLIEPTLGDLFSNPKALEKGIIRRDGAADQIGIIAFSLAIFAVIRKPANKFIWFLLAVVVFVLLFATSKTFFYFIWAYVPVFASFRYVDRGLVLFAFAGSILAALGAIELNEILKKKYGEKISGYIIWAILGLVFLNLYLFGYNNVGYGTKVQNFKEALDSHEILKYISSQPGYSRQWVYETRGIDWGTELYTVPYKIENIYGYEGAWLVDYMNIHLSVALNDPAKQLGMLNVKYITSHTPINVTGFRLEKVFPNCTVCYPNLDVIQKSWGPYLYTNDEFINRAIFIKNSVLVVGSKDDVQKVGYFLLTAPSFNPKNTIIIFGDENVNKYSANELSRFTSILLASQNSVDSASVPILQDYIAKGGKLMPDITKPNPSLTQQEIYNYLGSLNSSYMPIADSKIIRKNFENMQVDVPNSKGFLLISELYSMYPGWNAKVDSKNSKIYRVNGVTSAVFIDSNSKVTFNYAPVSFSFGLWISLATAIIVLGFSIYRKVK